MIDISLGSDDQVLAMLETAAGEEDRQLRVLWLLALPRLLPNKTEVLARTLSPASCSALSLVSRPPSDFMIGFFDAAKLGDFFRVLAVVGKGVVAHVDAGEGDHVIVAADEDRDDARAVGLQRQWHQIKQHVHLRDNVGGVLHVVRNGGVDLGLGLARPGLHRLRAAVPFRGRS